MIEDIAPNAAASRSGTAVKEKIPSAASAKSLRNGYFDGAHRAHINDAPLLVADPTDQTAEEAVALGHGAKRAKGRTGDQAEVAGVAGICLKTGDASEGAIEGADGEETPPGFTGAYLSDGVHYVRARAPRREHFANDVGWILEVGINRHDNLAGGVVDAGRECCLMAKVA